MNSFTSLDWLVLAIYFGGTMCVGLYFWRKSRSTEGFTAAERSLPGWLVGLSIFATYLSSISYLALPGKAFVDNWNAFVYSLAIPISTWIAVVYFLPYYRNSGDVSAYSNLEHRFGTWARLYASVFYLCTQLARIGVVTYLLALPMSVLFGWDIRIIILITGITVTVYTFIGGILAVIWTDAIQTVVLLAGAIVALVFLAVKIDGGAMPALQSAFEQGKFSLGDPGIATDSKGIVSLNLGGATILVVMLYGICDNLRNFGIDQSYVQRYQTAKTEGDARRSLWLGAIMYIPVSALFFLIGTLLFSFYHSKPAELKEVYEVVAHQKLMQEGVQGSFVTDTEGNRVFSPEYQTLIDAKAATLQEKDIGDRVFPHFIGKHLPPGLTGLLIAAIFSAGMSTISGSLNSSATLILRDYYLRFVRPNASEKESMRILYLGTILWGALGTGIAFVLIALTDSALDIWWTLVSIFGGGMLGLFLLGMLSKRPKNLAAIIAVIIGTAGIVYFALPEILRWMEKQGFKEAAESVREWAIKHMGSISPYHSFMVQVFVVSIIVLVGLFLGLMINRKPKE